MNGTRPFLLDCDTGRDDALAIWSALGLGLPLCGVITSYGNVTLEKVIENTSRVLALAGRDDLPLWQGNKYPSRHHAGFENIVLPRQGVSGNGLCDVELPSSKYRIYKPLDSLANSIRAIAEDKGPLDYIITGPATNLAFLIRALDADVHSCIGHVTMMGGKFTPLWDQLPGADFNIVCDPFAVHEILESGLIIRFVSMNVTWPICMGLDQIEQLSGETEIARASKAIMTAYCQRFAPEPIFRFHDPVAMLAAFEPHVFRAIKLHVECNDANQEFGRLIENPEGASAFLAEPDFFQGEEFLRLLLAALYLTQR
jgi:inosine-uridine nucleoside N-ribohydrolase